MHVLSPCNTYGKYTKDERITFFISISQKNNFNVITWIMFAINTLRTQTKHDIASTAVKI